MLLATFLVTNGLWVFFMVLVLRQNQRLRALLAERQLLDKPDDIDILAHLEAAEASGSALAQRLLLQAKEVPLLPTAVAENPSRQRLKRLKGEAMHAYQMDMNASKSPSERFKVIQRWHKKGYIFPPALRRTILETSTDEDTRNSHRKMFDEQDDQS